VPELRDKHGKLIPLSADPGHRITADWMGEEVLTLEDLLRPRLRALCVGINPSGVSVGRGHYYQGQQGQRFLGRLRDVGLIPAAAKGTEGDVAFAADVGFTDIIKRPTGRADELRNEEFEHGKEALVKKIKRFEPGLVVFAYKDAAKPIFGKFEGNGFVADLRLGRSTVFVMPGPMELNEKALPTLATLAHFLRG
jgi:TDG/mug DNA glycosylase family protein